MSRVHNQGFIVCMYIIKLKFVTNWYVLNRGISFIIRKHFWCTIARHSKSMSRMYIGFLCNISLHLSVYRCHYFLKGTNWIKCQRNKQDVVCGMHDYAWISMHNLWIFAIFSHFLKKSIYFHWHFTRAQGSSMLANYAKNSNNA